LFKEFENKAALYKNTLSSFYNEQEDRLESIFQNIKQEFIQEKDVFLEDFDDKYKSIIPAQNDAQEISRSVKLLEKIFKESQERMLKRINPYLDHLKRLSFEVNEDNLVGYYKDQFEEIKEEWNKTYELAQLGIAVEIIDHQFNTLYSQLAESIKTIKKHLHQDKDAEKVYRSVSSAFGHLQDNYKLLQPLYRTTKIRSTITGTELKNYAQEFFVSRLENSQIKFTITRNGEKWTANSYESIFKPVLINIVNNAIYWLQKAEQKEIRIDAIGEELLIMNSGEQIEDYQLEDIFKLFYSNRPKGRGIGLYLAKQSLNGIGYDIMASNDKKYNLLNGACFIIKPYSANG
jgi:signal transduction histidine kinase